MALKSGLKKTLMKDKFIFDENLPKLPGRIFANGGRPYLYVKLPNFILGVSNDLIVDHINGNTYDNRKSNLRVATYSQNNTNARKTSKRTTSIYKGVTWQRSTSKWLATINKNKVRYYLGLFNTEAEAARAYDGKAKELHGEFARLNFNEGE